MKKLFLSLAIFVMVFCANAQTNQYFWYQGNLMMGNPIAQIDSVTFENVDTDSILIYLPRTIIKEVHDTVEVAVHDTIYITKYSCLPEGALAGEFSVSATAKVRFSKGNLQYVGTWQFAEHQWDYLGNNQSDDYRDWFGWGTGDAPNNDDDYSTFVDWGVNAITNGGNEANLWRTLTKEEWVYLFCERADATTLFGLGSVNDINGAILLPDDWILPAGVSFMSSMTPEMADEEGNYWGEGNYFSDNKYTAEQWSVMESAGAVFLPASHRGGSSGEYWTATPNGTDGVYHFGFHSFVLGLWSDSSRDDNLSVRLVHDVE